MNKLKCFKPNTFLSVFYSVFLCLFIFTFSISLPIVFRGFYFAQIKPLEIPQNSGFSETEIKDAYNEVLDYLTLPNKEFSVGVMRYSQEGKSHFEDCKNLFVLNFSVLSISAVVVFALRIFAKFNKTSYKIGKRSASFYSGVVTISLPLVLGGVAALDFDKAFTVFHKIFFPGKDNWIFNSFTDEIIDILPQEFFMNCAILIAVSVVLISVCLIFKDLVAKRSRS